MLLKGVKVGRQLCDQRGIVFASTRQGSLRQKKILQHAVCCHAHTEFCSVPCPGAAREGKQLGCAALREKESSRLGSVDAAKSPNVAFKGHALCVIANDAATPQASSQIITACTAESTQHSILGPEGPTTTHFVQPAWMPVINVGTKPSQSYGVLVRTRRASLTIKQQGDTPVHAMQGPPRAVQH